MSDAANLAGCCRAKVAEACTRPPCPCNHDPDYLERNPQWTAPDTRSADLEARCQRYRTALELIASCESRAAGDVVDIARMALEGGAWGRAIEHVQSVLPHMDQTGDKELPR